MKLYIGNKNYSSWSMRAWVLMRQMAIPFQEVMVPFDSFGADSAFKSTVEAIGPTGRVPILVDYSVVVWDTLAIAEYLAESFPAQRLWPASKVARARARSVCAEMHSGFSHLRTHCPMNIEASLPDLGARLLARHEGLRGDLERVTGMWSELLATHGGPLLFGEFTIPDAYFAPVVMRIRAYNLPVPAPVAAYVDRVAALPAVRMWTEDALAEKSWVDFDEPYRNPDGSLRDGVLA